MLHLSFEGKSPDLTMLADDWITLSRYRGGFTISRKPIAQSSLIRNSLAGNQVLKLCQVAARSWQGAVRNIVVIKQNVVFSPLKISMEAMFLCDGFLLQALCDGRWTCFSYRPQAAIERRDKR